MSGSAVRVFDSLAAAEQAFGDALRAGLVYKVEISGERHILTVTDIESIPCLVLELAYSGELRGVIDAGVLNMTGIKGIPTSLSDCSLPLIIL